jgi:hypothetical protein
MIHKYGFTFFKEEDAFDYYNKYMLIDSELESVLAEFRLQPDQVIILNKIKEQVLNSRRSRPSGGCRPSEFFSPSPFSDRTRLEDPNNTIINIDYVAKWVDGYFSLWEEKTHYAYLSESQWIIYNFLDKVIRYAIKHGMSIKYKGFYLIQYDNIRTLNDKSGAITTKINGIPLTYDEVSDFINGKKSIDPITFSASDHSMFVRKII